MSFSFDRTLSRWGQTTLKSVWADERIESLVSEMDTLQTARGDIAAAKAEASLTAEDVRQLNEPAAFTGNCGCVGCSHLDATSLQTKEPMT